MSTVMHITPDMVISDILARYPHKGQKLAQAMNKAGLHCTSCRAANWESLEMGMASHGKDQAAIEALVRELNAILEEKLDLGTITLTPRAAAKLRQFAEEEGKRECALRFGISGGGCGGVQYILDFSEQAEAEDMVYESEGMSIHVARTMIDRLLGSVIDYVDGLQGAGFKISNPNIKSSCHCSH